MHWPAWQANFVRGQTGEALWEAKNTRRQVSCGCCAAVTIQMAMTSSSITAPLEQRGAVEPEYSYGIRRLMLLGKHVVVMAVVRVRSLVALTLSFLVQAPKASGPRTRQSIQSLWATSLLGCWATQAWRGPPQRGG